METVKEYNEMIRYYEEKSKDNSITDLSTYDLIIDSLNYFIQIRNELARSIMQRKSWEKYLNAIEKQTFLDLGGSPEIYSLTTEELVAVNINDRDETKRIKL
ncbi:MAG: hypothetical protein HFE04_01595 [Bacilli bacterium]|nr:hypothetical protein [Bacilli bacterium]